MKHRRPSRRHAILDMLFGWHRRAADAKESNGGHDMSARSDATETKNPRHGWSQDNMSRAEKTKRQYLFATARFVSTDWVSSELVNIPRSVVHAKEMGTNRTLCGEDTSSWTKIWDQPFRTVNGKRCPSCVVMAASAHATVGTGER